MNKANGMTRGFDKAGRFVLPAEMIRTLKLEPTDMLEISCDGVFIHLKKYNPFCILTGNTEGPFIEVEGHNISMNAAEKIAEEFMLRRVKHGKTV